VFTHFPPVDTYNAELSGREMARAVRNFREKGRARRSLVPFGYGDGGGGPTEEMLARARRLSRATMRNIRQNLFLAFVYNALSIPLAALGLLDRAFGEVEPHERDHPAPRALSEGERPVVRDPERRVPVGLVEAEHEAARDRVAVHEPLQLLVLAAEAVDARAEVDVRVEDLRVLRQILPEHLVVLRDECFRPRKLVVHGPESTYGPGPG